MKFFLSSDKLHACVFCAFVCVCVCVCARVCVYVCVFAKWHTKKEDNVGATLLYLFQQAKRWDSNVQPKITLVCVRWPN